MPDSAASRSRMPLAVYILGLSVFALGTSEFMLSGLLPPIADDMNVSIPVPDSSYPPSRSAW